MSEFIKAPKGLAGVVTDITTISKVMPETNSLTYRGYPVQELTEHCSFEEVAFLMVEGELPSEKELSEFTSKEESLRGLPSYISEAIKLYPKNAHPMDCLRSGISLLGMSDHTGFEVSTQENKEKFLNILAKAPTIAAYAYRHSIGEAFIAPKKGLSFSENFFYMCFGEVPDSEIVNAFDASLILYAEHSFNASTFTGRVIASTMSDIYSAITGGIGALKGPLHGGANEMVMHMMKGIDDPKKAKDWMLNAIKNKQKVMGFGHRVYRSGDSRVPTMSQYMRKIADLTDNQKWVQMYDALEEVMVSEKGIYPNLDFPAGPTYYMMGFPIDFFTPIFVLARITGWTAHILEQQADNRIIRPLSDYVGVDQRKVVPVNQR